MTIRRLAVAVLLSLLALPAVAQLSKEHKEWGEGPVRWIMTKEEERDWKNVKNDQSATDFIDLFWARRDPTPGTAVNEFQQEFFNRAAYADNLFGEGKVRGAMTERGRVVTVLGFPTGYDRLGKEQSKMTANTGAGNSPHSAGSGAPQRRLGGKDVWLYDRETAMKYGLPKIEVVFLQDLATGAYRRDTQRHDFMFALPNAIKSQVKSAGLVALPEWAQRGGLKPQVQLVMQETPAAVAPTTVSTTAVKATAGHLTLLTDAVRTINPQSGKNPLDGITSKATFTRSEEFGYAFQLCSGTTDESPTLKVGVTITGTVGGEKIRMTAPVEETVPDAIKGMAGCYLVRGQLGPITDLQMQPGDYQLAVNVEDPLAGRSYNLTQPFKVE